MKRSGIIVKFLIGGSPCTNWSIAQPKNREVEPEGIGWELFKNYLTAKEKFKPDFFLYENNKSASPLIKTRIAEELNTPLQYINSAMVSAQNRERFYVHNIKGVKQPDDRHISLIDILDQNDFKPYNGGQLIRKNPDISQKVDRMYMIGATNEQCSIGCRVYSLYGKSKTICANGGGGGAKTGLYMTRDGIKSLSVTGVEKLQTMPVGYTKSVRPEVGITGLGNGWTAEVIIHILKHANVPLDEEIVVLSMYDGIGTGRYCFDKLGYKNITYYAYEIESSVMQIANDNYPDIIQCGDAFEVRNENWCFERLIRRTA